MLIYHGTPLPPKRQGCSAEPGRALDYTVGRLAFLQQLNAIRNATYFTMSNMEETVERSLEALAQAESAIGAEPDDAN